jgi:hypothetical protein
MRTGFFVVVLSVLVGDLAGCGGAETSLQDQMVGLWTTNKGVYVSFNADGTYGKGFTPEAALAPDDPMAGMERGTWIVDDGILTFVTSEPTSQYGCDDTGAYEVELTDTGDQILATLIEDTCAKRRDDFPSGLTRHTDTTP